MAEGRPEAALQCLASLGCHASFGLWFEVLSPERRALARAVPG
jgi:hypothetical protein